MVYKILHVSLFSVISSGQFSQLSYEKSASMRLQKDGILWETVAFVKKRSDEDNTFEIELPRWARKFQLSKLYTWMYVTRMRKRYDFILMRSITPDPYVPLFGLFIKNLITVHHAKEVEEISLTQSGVKRSLIRFAEQKVKPLALRKLYGVAGVTKEITKFQFERFPWVKVCAEYPNGTDYDLIHLVDRANRESDNEIHAIFVASKFHAWHGLDLLLFAIQDFQLSNATKNCTFHLVGHVFEDQLAMIRDLNLENSVKVHGHISKTRIAEIMSYCDVAITSLALERKNLLEASTLKVRDYLASGLPVYSRHSDSALPQDFPFFYVDRNEINIQKIIDFAEQNSSVPRSTVREISKEFIDKGEIMKKLMLQIY